MESECDEARWNIVGSGRCPVEGYMQVEVSYWGCASCLWDSVLFVDYWGSSGLGWNRKYSKLVRHWLRLAIDEPDHNIM